MVVLELNRTKAKHISPSDYRRSALEKNEYNIHSKRNIRTPKPKAFDVQSDCKHSDTLGVICIARYVEEQGIAVASEWMNVNISGCYNIDIDGNHKGTRITSS